jgi:uncharacterized protein YdcH (DUF465 family)
MEYFPMFGEHHDLVHELPEYREKIHEMKLGNAHFARLFDEYNEVEHEVRRIEQELETPSDDYTEELKKRRLALKDELFQMLQTA